MVSRWSDCASRDARPRCGRAHDRVRAARTGLLAAALGAAGACAAHAPVGPPWRSPLASDHPLVGRVLDTSSGELVLPAGCDQGTFTANAR